MQADQRPQQALPAPKGTAILAGAAFIRFVEAVERGDFVHAGAAQTELGCLGYAVTLRLRRRRPTKGGGR